VPDPHEVNQLVRFSHLGIQFVLVFGLGFFLGYVADQRLGTLPLFTILGVLIGFAGAFYQLYLAVFGPDSRKQDDGSKGTS
jgi:F0F1-type ATP synthase assembly protein I